MRFSVYFLSIALACTATAFLYEPVSLALFKAREPYFAYPIKRLPGAASLRHDVYGDGRYGAKRSGGRRHTGIDIRAKAGTPVYASKSGIAFCGRIPTGYGKYVMIYHPDGSETMYAHLSEWRVSSTRKTMRGQLIGLTGKTGNAKNGGIDPHLHFEIRKGGEPVNPEGFLK